MSIASNIATANSTIASSLAAIAAQLVILAADKASDPQTFAKSNGPQAAGAVVFGVQDLLARANPLCSDNR
jgi:hypothetical protein